MILASVQLFDMFIQISNTFCRKSVSRMLKIFIQMSIQYLLNTRICYFGDFTFYLSLAAFRTQIRTQIADKTCGIIMFTRLFGKIIDFHFFTSHIAPNLFILLKILFHPFGIISERQQFLNFHLQIIVHNHFRRFQSDIELYLFFQFQINQTENSILVHRFADSPILPSLHRLYLFSILIMQIMIRSTIDDPLVLFEADNNILQSSTNILRKSRPRLLQHPRIVAITLRGILVADNPLQFSSGDGRILASRFVVKIFNNVATGTSYYNGIHGMMAVVDSLFIKVYTLRHNRNNLS